MKIKISLIDDKGIEYGGEISLTKVTSETSNLDVVIPPESTMKNLAKECGVPVEKLQKIIEYDGVGFNFVGNLDESNFYKKRAIACHYILTAWTRGKGIEWVSSSVLVEALRKLGIEVKNMNRSINPKEGIFRTDGEKSGVKYALTIQGWKKGLEMLKIEAEKA